MKKLIKNKRGDIASIMFAAIIVFTMGFLFFMVSHFNAAVLDTMTDTIREGGMNTSYTEDAIAELTRSNNTAWDYAFLGVFLGSLIAIGLSAYAVRISPVYYWIYGVMSFSVLVVGVMLSNLWQQFAADPEFSVTIARFPITNIILGSYYPMIVTAIIFIMMMILFGKPPRRDEI